MLSGEHWTMETRRGNFQVIGNSNRIFNVKNRTDLVADISTIINIDAIFTINIDAQRGCAAANKFDADQFVAQCFHRCRNHLC
ncbi:hypothetical protein D3C71_1884180 [compost metagenome]